MRTQGYASLVFALLALLVCSNPLCAAIFRGESVVTVAEGAVVEDEMYAAGQTVSIIGSVLDDLLAAGDQVKIGGRISESATLAGSTVDISGTVDGNLRAAGGTVDISGTIGRNATLAGGTVVFSEGARITRDLRLAGGQIAVAGKIGRNARIAGGQVTIDGEIGGDARIDASKLVVGPKAVIRGNLIYTSPQRAEIAPGAQILGETVFQAKPERKKEPSYLWRLPLWILGLAGLFIVGCVSLAVGPATVVGTADRLQHSPWLCLLVGFLLLAVMPVVIAIVIATLIGIPLGLILLAMYLITIYISRAFVGIAVGRFILRIITKPEESPYLALLVGLVVLWLLFAIPFVGWLIHLAALLFGLGAIAIHRYEQARGLRAEGRI